MNSPFPVEARLREALREPRTLPPVPDADDMLRRVAGRRRRRSLLTHGAVVLAVVAAAAGTALLAVHRPSSAPPVATTAQPTPAHSAPPTDLAMPRSPQVGYADAQHAFVLLSQCSAGTGVGGSGGTCTVWVAASDDGGRTWRPHRVPGLTYPSQPVPAIPYLRVIDARRLIVDGSTSMASTDGGVTWAVQPAPSLSLPSIPAGSDVRVQVDTASATTPGTLKALVRLRSGATATLSTPPAGSYLPRNVSAYAIVAADQSVWIDANGDPGNGGQFVSRSDGHKWTVVPAPAAAKGYAELKMINGTILYEVDVKRYRLWRSSNDGRMWTELTLPFNESNMDDHYLPYQARPDGTLVIGDPEQGTTYRLAPGASQFQAVPWDPHLRAVPAGTGYVQASGSDVPMPAQVAPSAYLVSPDYRTWYSLPFRLSR